MEQIVFSHRCTHLQQYSVQFAKLQKQIVLSLPFLWLGSQKVFQEIFQLFGGDLDWRDVNKALILLSAGESKMG